MLCASVLHSLDIGVEDMRCPLCGHEETKVIDSRESDAGDAIRRRRECLGCQQRFTTYERREEVPLMVVKKNGDREPFDRNKLFRGLAVAVTKRNVTSEQLDELIDEVEAELHDHKLEIPSKKLGDLVLRRLRNLDRVAYVRFASVYKDFQDLDEFTRELKELK